jgi:FdhD protein
MMPETAATTRRRITRISQSANTEDDDSLVVEEPLEIRVRGKGIAVTMRTPGYDFELAAGFLCSEGVLRKRSDVLAINHCQMGDHEERGNVVNVYLSPKVELDLENLSRHVFASSSCGLCGKATIESVRPLFPPVRTAPSVHADLLRQLPARLFSTQSVFAETGGLHAAALFTTRGELIAAREDVGRHNAVDKLIGHAFLEDRLPLADSLLLVSGRASFEIMQKALAAGIPLVAAISAPSHLAVDFARESGQTLVGFLREDRMNVYAGKLAEADSSGR